jgi:hypothetical protein
MGWQGLMKEAREGKGGRNEVKSLHMSSVRSAAQCSAMQLRGGGCRKLQGYDRDKERDSGE